MLENVLSTAVGQQPALGKAFYDDSLVEAAKRKKKEDDLNKAEVDFQAAQGFMPEKNKQAAEGYLKGMEQAYIDGDMEVYNVYKGKFASSVAVGKARYEQGYQTYSSAQKDSEFANVEGGKLGAQQQWNTVMNEGFSTLPKPDGKGNLIVTYNDQTIDFEETPFADIKQINAGVSDYVLNSKSSVPEMSIPMLGVKNFVPFLNMADDESFEQASGRAMQAFDDIAMTEDMRKSAALYFAREVEGVGEQGLLTTQDKERAYAKYAALNPDGSVPVATASAMQAYRTAIESQLEPYYVRNKTEDSPFGISLGAEDKKILDQPLIWAGRENYVRPDGRANRTPVYKMDFKRLGLSYDKIEGRKVREVYFDMNGQLDHMVIALPAKAVKSEMEALAALLATGNVTMNDVPVNPDDIEKQVNREVERAPNKTIRFRIFDPQELNNTFGNTVGSLLTQKIQAQTAQDMRAAEDNPAPFDAMAEAMAD